MTTTSPGIEWKQQRNPRTGEWYWAAYQKLGAPHYYEIGGITRDDCPYWIAR